MTRPPSIKFAKGGSHELILQRIRDIPALPEVVNKIVQMVGSPTARASEIADLISYDPGLSSRVLRMVNSAAYGIQRQISSIQHGIMILGFNTVRGLVLSASIFKIFKNQAQNTGFDHRAFWEHSLKTALASKVIAKTRRLGDADDAFSAGMLHDIGKVVLDVYFPTDYAPVLQQARISRIPPHGTAFLEVEQTLLGTTHADIGASLGVKWKLPVNIQEVIEFHHTPQRAQKTQDLVYVVAMANELTHLYDEQHGLLLTEQFSPGLLEYLKIDEDGLRDLGKRYAQEIESISDLLDSLE